MPKHLPLLIVLLLFVTVIGARGLNADALWFDEFWSVYNAGWADYDGTPRTEPLSPRDVWHQVATIDPIHPPAYALILNMWGRVFGSSVFALRLFSFYAALLSVAMMYRAAYSMMLPRHALLATVLFGTSAFYVHYFHEMRMYTLLLLLVNMAMWSYWQLLYFRGGWFAAALFVVSLSGLVYTQYLSVLLLVGLAVYHLLFAPKNRRWWMIIGLVLVAALSYLLWLPIVWDFFNSVRGGESRAGVYSMRAILTDTVAVFSNVHMETTDGAWLFAVIAFGAAWIRRWHDKAFTLTVFSVTAVLMLIINAQTGMFIHIRYVLLMLPLAVMILAGGLQHFTDRYRNQTIATWWLVAFVLWWLLMGFGQYANYEARYNRAPEWTLDWPHIVATLQPRIDDADVVVIQSAGTRTWWDYEQVRRYYSHDLPVTLQITPTRPYADNDTYRADIADMLNDTPRFLHVIDSTQSAAALDDFRAIVADTYALCDTVMLDGLQLDSYALNCDG